MKRNISLIVRAGIALMLALFVLPAATAGAKKPKSDKVASKSDKRTQKADKKSTLKVLEFNVFADAYPVAGGWAALADEIARADADVVLLCEVINHKGPAIDMLVGELKKRGRTYYGYGYTGQRKQGRDVGLLSKYPFKTQDVTADNFDGSVYMKARIDYKGHDILLYPAHMDYKFYAPYMPRGYSPIGSAKKLDAPVSDVDSVIAVNRMSTRDESAAAFVKEVASEKADLIILAGDFNEPSHLDWCKKTRNLFDHNGCVVPWDISATLCAAGFKDAYRVVHRNAATHPGFTYPASMSIAPEALSGARDKDERERLDYVYYRGKKNFRPTRAYIIGPTKTIVQCKHVEETSADEIVKPIDVWPSDHKAVMIEFEVK